MKNINLICKSGSLSQFIIALFLFTSPFAGVYAACCAGHGGVASCNKTTGVQMCKDGSASPTCKCAITKAAKKTTTTTTTTTTKPKTVKAVPATAKSTTTTTTAVKPAPKTTAAPTSGTSAKGCCSRHGGVSQCNKSTGVQMCKDGTASPSCTCH